MRPRLKISNASACVFLNQHVPGQGSIGSYQWPLRLARSGPPLADIRDGGGSGDGNNSLALFPPAVRALDPTCMTPPSGGEDVRPTTTEPGGELGRGTDEAMGVRVRLLFRSAEK